MYLDMNMHILAKRLCIAMHILWKQGVTILSVSEDLVLRHDR